MSGLKRLILSFDHISPETLDSIGLALSGVCKSLKHLEIEVTAGGEIHESLVSLNHLRSISSEDY